VKRPPVLATLVFLAATVLCATAAAVSSNPTPTSIHPSVGDVVVFVAPRETAACRRGDVASGRVLGLPGDHVASQNVRVGSGLRSQLLVNGQPVALLPRIGAQRVASLKVGRDRVFLLGAAGCDSRVLGTVPRASLVGYTQGALQARVAVVQKQLDDRITGEKYVAAVYALVVAAFLVYLLIHAGRFSRLERELAALGESPAPAGEERAGA
jgi:Signal peptidase, peptidase S26